MAPAIGPGSRRDSSDLGRAPAQQRHLAEFGIVAPVGRKGVTELLQIVADTNDERVSEVARACLAALGTMMAKGERYRNPVALAA